MASGCRSSRRSRTAPSTSRATDRFGEALHRQRRRWAAAARTTGESPALDEDEIAALIERTLCALADGRVPVFAGVGGNATAKVEKELKRLSPPSLDGILSVCPYYNRPSQDGLIAHFNAHRGGDRP